MGSWFRALACASGVVLVAACSSSDGRTLPPPPSNRTTTSVNAPVVGQPSDDPSAVEVFSLSSPSFVAGGTIPARFTCVGEDVSPPLEWASVPEGAVELAIVVRDRSAGGFVHWIVTGIDPTVQGIGVGGVPEGAVEGRNDGGAVGWFGPCPPAGSTHTYELSIHALDAPLELAADLAPDDAAARVELTSTSHAELLGTVAG